MNLFADVYSVHVAIDEAVVINKQQFYTVDKDLIDSYKKTLDDDKLLEIFDSIVEQSEKYFFLCLRVTPRRQQSFVPSKLRNEYEEHINRVIVSGTKDFVSSKFDEMKKHNKIDEYLIVGDNILLRFDTTKNRITSG